MGKPTSCPDQKEEEIQIARLQKNLLPGEQNFSGMICAVFWNTVRHNK
jgi:hypothetical protein